MAAVSLGRYRLVERIAQGGMGEVYRALDLGFGGIERTVALKRISPELARADEFAKTFVNEAKLSFLLGHSNVVRVLDVGEDDGLYLVLEWVHGGDLGTLMATLRRDSGQPVPTRLALTIAAEVARGLDYAHRLLGPDGAPLGLVHRDVSPSNILLSVEGEVKVTDFGIARSRMRRSVSMPGQLKGKLFYMAPEQARGEEIDARADVFALGAVLYEMLAGANPFLVASPDGDLLDRVREGSFPSLGSTAPQTAPGLVAIVERAMAVARDDRFPSTRELRLALIDHAVQNGYALSLDELGEFVRTLAQSGLATPTAPITRPGSRARAHSDPGLSLQPRRPLAVIEGGKTRAPASDQRASSPTTSLRRPPSLGASVPATRRGPVLALVTLVVIGLFGLLGAKLLRRGGTHEPPVHSDGAGWPSAPAAPPSAPR